MTDTYREWSIEQGPDGCFYAYGPNYDASWEDDETGFAGSGGSVEAATYDEIKFEIDAWIEENPDV